MTLLGFGSTISPKAHVLEGGAFRRLLGHVASILISGRFRIKQAIGGGVRSAEVALWGHDLDGCSLPPQLLPLLSPS